MLNKDLEKDQKVIAKYARRSDTLLTLVSNDNVAVAAKRVAAKNPVLSTSAIRAIVDDMYIYDKEVLMGIAENPCISREDLVKLARHHDIEVAKHALSARRGLTANPSVLSEFIYSDRVELAMHAMEIGINGLHREVALEIATQAKSETNSDLVEICIRTVSDPFVIHALAMRNEPELLIALSKNRHLPAATVELMLNREDRDINLNLLQYPSLSLEHLSRIIDYSLKRDDLELLVNALKSPYINGSELDRIMEQRHDFYERMIEKLPYISEETKTQIRTEMEHTLQEALRVNPALSIDLINTQYNLEIERPEVSVMPSIESLLGRDDLRPLDLFEDLDSLSSSNIDAEELLRLADQEDIDPDIQKTVMLGLINHNRNTLESMNAMQSKLEKSKSQLVSLVGVNSIGYKKNSNTYLSHRPLKMISRVRIAMHSFGKNLSNAKNLIKDTVGNKITEVKDKLPTEKMADMNLPKQVFTKVVTEARRLNFAKKKKNKKGFKK